jgi:hypothetical protein
VFKRGNKEKTGVLTNSGTSRPMYKSRKQGRSLIVKQDTIIRYKKSRKGQTEKPIKKRRSVTFASNVREKAPVNKNKWYQGISDESKAITKKQSNYQKLETGSG